MDHECQMLDRFQQHDLELSKLNKVVFDGNGSPPLTSRVAVLEVEFQNGRALRASVWVSILGAALNVVTAVILFRFGIH